MRDTLITLIAIIVVIGLIVAFNKYYRQGAGPKAAPARDFSKEASLKPEEGNKLVAVVETSKGTFSFELLPKDAPGTVENFVRLARKGFYDGTIFHRVVPGFVIQGGDPTGTGAGGPGYTIKAEFNARKHVEGTVAMARSDHPDSAGSQFYVCLAPAPHLDRKYTVFGRVIEGMDVVRAINQAPTNENDRPLEDIIMKKVTVQEVTASEE
ncbi:MAG: peptidylprolyl isomerase [Candidatus Abyssobacteria bacterium SURF_17]|uniref:Peptidyl-prolyl cis-trans isomerase n=1 Tax=Candidatus Abyssobacteria bacterium SURF_17 TaxID=2093361 RepID=A0A419EVI3_9BACT|nr:MAG: peptidylprolyl isomerase [Candidatus Abyssubacteria bacterium SURF_17]